MTGSGFSKDILEETNSRNEAGWKYTQIQEDLDKCNVEDNLLLKRS